MEDSVACELAKDGAKDDNCSNEILATQLYTEFFDMSQITIALGV